MTDWTKLQQHMHAERIIIDPEKTCTMHKNIVAHTKRNWNSSSMKKYSSKRNPNSTSDHAKSWKGRGGVPTRGLIVWLTPFYPLGYRRNDDLFPASALFNIYLSPCYRCYVCDVNGDRLHTPHFVRTHPFLSFFVASRVSDGDRTTASYVCIGIGS